MNIFSTFDKDMMDMEEHLIAQKVKDKGLFELYCACLTGLHANVTINNKSPEWIAKEALAMAKCAKEVWNERSSAN
jgi:hypothetical protein